MSETWLHHFLWSTMLVPEIWIVGGIWGYYIGCARTEYKQRKHARETIPKLPRG